MAAPRTIRRQARLLVCGCRCIHSSGDQPGPSAFTTNHRAKKRPPERLCPRGAEDSNLIRERLDSRRPAARSQAIDGGRSHRVSEACRRHPCQRVRFVVRRKALLASPVQTHHMDPFYVSGVRFELLFVAALHTFIDVVRRENMGIAKPGQGRFFGLFCRRFRPFKGLGSRQTSPSCQVKWPKPASRDAKASGRESRLG
jgi:hypothetical protein